MFTEKKFKEIKSPVEEHRATKCQALSQIQFCWTPANFPLYFFIIIASFPLTSSMIFFKQHDYLVLVLIWKIYTQIMLQLIILWFYWKEFLPLCCYLGPLCILIHPFIHSCIPSSDKRLETSRVWNETEIKQNSVELSWVQKPLNVPCFLFVGKNIFFESSRPSPSSKEQAQAVNRLI